MVAAVILGSASNADRTAQDTCFSWAYSGYPCDLQEVNTGSFGVADAVDCSQAKTCGMCALAGALVDPTQSGSAFSPLWPAECPVQPLAAYAFSDMPVAPHALIEVDNAAHCAWLADGNGGGGRSCTDPTTTHDDTGCVQWTVNGFSCDTIEGKMNGQSADCTFARACGFCGQNNFYHYYSSGKNSLPSSLLPSLVLYRNHLIAFQNNFCELGPTLTFWDIMLQFQ
jgi:hypothetical protein